MALPKTPMAIRGACLLVGAGVGLSALWQGFGAATRADPGWFLLGFEGLALVGALFAVLVGLGKFRHGPALAMLCVAGTILVGTVLGYTADRATYRGIQAHPISAARLGASALMFLLAGVTVWARRPAPSIRALVTGSVLGAIALGVMGAWAFTPLSASLAAVHPMVRTLALLFGGLIVVGLLSASAHYGIRSLEHGREEAST